MNQGQATQSLIESLRSTPVILGVLAFNVAFMALLAWGAYEIVTKTLEVCGK